MFKSVCFLSDLANDVIFTGVGIDRKIERLILVNLDEKENYKFVITQKETKLKKQKIKLYSRNLSPKFVEVKNDVMILMDKFLGFARKQEINYFKTLYITSFEFKKKKIPNFEVLSNLFTSSVHKKVSMSRVDNAFFEELDLEKKKILEEEKEMIYAEDSFHWFVRGTCSQENRQTQLYFFSELINTDEGEICIFLKFSRRPIPQVKDQEELDCPESCKRHMINLEKICNIKKKEEKGEGEEEKRIYKYTLYDLICSIMDFIGRNSDYDFWINNCQTYVKKMFYKNGCLMSRFPQPNRARSNTIIDEVIIRESM